MSRTTIEAVRCIQCRELHEIGSETYLTIHGNIYIGESGGVVGNNFPSYVNVKGKTLLTDPEEVHFDLDWVKRTIVCRNGDCLDALLYRNKHQYDIR